MQCCQHERGNDESLLHIYVASCIKTETNVSGSKQLSYQQTHTKGLYRDPVSKEKEKESSKMMLTVILQWHYSCMLFTATNLKNLKISLVKVLPLFHGLSDEIH